MNKLMELAIQLGYKENFVRLRDSKLYHLHQWLIRRHKTIVTLSPAINQKGILWKYAVIDARTNFYNVKIESKYEYSYIEALEDGLHKALLYLQ